MPEFWSTIKRTFVIAYVVVLHGVVLYFVLEKYGFIVPLDSTLGNTNTNSSHNRNAERSPATATPLSNTPVKTQAQSPSIASFTTPLNSASLVIPVVGVNASQLIDTFDQARSGGRVHDAIDIPAPAGTAVIAAVDGTIAKFHDSEFGGITIYQLSEDKNFVLYYAHLQRRMETLREGDRVRRGETIGFVGDTGNAGAGNYHLHFAIWYVTDPKKFWTGENLNPYPLLRNGLSLPVR